MTQYYTLEDIMGEPKKYSLEDILGRSKKSRSKTMTLTDILGDDLPEVAEPVRPTTDQDPLEEFFEQTARGVSKTLTLGLDKYLWEDKEPVSTEAQVGRGAGEFLGFLGTPIKLGKFAAGKVGSIASRLGAKHLAKTGKLGQLAHRTADYFIPHMTTLGVAEAVSDITDPAGAPKRFLHGAKIGAIFGAAGLSHVFKNPVANQFMSQFGGRALLNVKSPTNSTSRQK